MTPARPTVASVAHDAVSITWADPGDSSITGYQVSWRNPVIHDRQEFETIEGDTGSLGTSYTDTGVAPETRYFYRVKARNAHGPKEQHGPDERLGCGGGEGEDKGVTPHGGAAVAETNAMGMVVDVSHCSKQTTLDAAVLSTDPIIATHVDAGALTPRSRNKDDEDLLAIAATGE